MAFHFWFSFFLSGMDGSRLRARIAALEHTVVTLTNDNDRVREWRRLALPVLRQAQDQRDMLVGLQQARQVLGATVAEQRRTIQRLTGELEHERGEHQTTRRLLVVYQAWLAEQRVSLSTPLRRCPCPVSVRLLTDEQLSAMFPGPYETRRYLAWELPTLEPDVVATVRSTSRPGGDPTRFLWCATMWTEFSIAFLRQPVVRDEAGRLPLWVEDAFRHFTENPGHVYNLQEELLATSPDPLLQPVMWIVKKILGGLGLRCSCEPSAHGWCAKDLTRLDISFSDIQCVFAIIGRRHRGTEASFNRALVVQHVFHAWTGAHYNNRVGMQKKSPLHGIDLGWCHTQFVDHLLL